MTCHRLTIWERGALVAVCAGIVGSIVVGLVAGGALSVAGELARLF